MDNKQWLVPKINVTPLILLTALGFTLAYNVAFFHNVATVYGAGRSGLLFMASLAALLFAVTVLLLALLCFRFFTKPVLIIVILMAAFASTFMNSYNVVIDTDMITNIAKTDFREVRDLINPKLIFQLLVMGLLPALLIVRTKITCSAFGREFFNRAKLLGFALMLIFISVAPFSGHYTSFFRENKILRYYSNPATFVYSTFKYLGMALGNDSARIREPLGTDARTSLTGDDRKLVVLVVGEAARADHFSLNGYQRQTNPLLAKEDVISFQNATSCGTATAYSVPCMFSVDGRNDFKPRKARNSENLLDVLTHAGVNVLWRDNNSDSKGVAAAIPFEDFRSAERNPVCDTECRDVGMLSGLPDYIAAHSERDIVIILHQMGNHGPAYFKRYPADFERFMPVCTTNELENCTDEELGNAYDNAILYTDYFLSEVISFLKDYDDSFSTAMLYMSDHGESLGENGLFLHGLPYMLAPDTQKQIASVLWFGPSYPVDRVAIRAKAGRAVSHDNYFHSVLGLLEISTAVHAPAKDLIIH